MFCTWFNLVKYSTVNPNKIYIYNYWIYVFTGFWAHEFKKPWKNILFKTYQSILAFFYSVFIISFAMDAYLVGKDLEKLSFNMTSSVLVFVTVLKIILLRVGKTEFEKLSNHLKYHLYLDSVGKSPEDKAILKEKAEDILLITKLFYFVLFVLYPLRIMADTAFDTRAYIVPLPFRAKFEPYYELTYAFQVIGVLHFLATVIAHDMLIYGVIIRFIGHYEILGRNFLKIKHIYPRKNFEDYIPGYSDTEEQKLEINDVLIRKTKNSEVVQTLLEEYEFESINLAKWIKKKKDREEKVFKILTDCIKHHQLLLSQIQSFCRIYSICFMIQAIGAVLLIGIVILYILFISSEVTLLLAQQVLYVMTTLMNILYLCSFGSDIPIKSQEVGKALYDTPWYEMDIKNQKLIYFILENLDKAPEFRGGGMVIINRVTYLKFLQTSYNMVAVFKNAYK